MTALDVTKRPLPTFRQWLDEHDPESRTADYQAFADLAQRTQLQPLEHLAPHQASFGRMWMGACVAAVELCNMEAIAHNRPNDEIISNLVRAFGTAAMYALASIAKPDTPFRPIAKALTEEFREATKIAADTLTEDFTKQT